MIRLLVIAILLLAAPVVAQIDYEVDNYGVFFDFSGMQTSTTAVIGPVDGYLLLLEPRAEFFDSEGWSAGCWSVQAMGGGMYLSGGATYYMTTAPRFISSMPPFLWLHATINSDYTPIGNEDTTWSDVKAMYR